MSVQDLGASSTLKKQFQTTFGLSVLRIEINISAVIPPQVLLSASLHSNPLNQD